MTRERKIREKEIGEPPIQVGWDWLRLPKIGGVAVFSTERGVCTLSFTEKADTAVRNFLETCLKPVTLRQGLGSYGSLLFSLKEYAEGWRSTFDTPLDFLTGTLFQRRVWSVLLEIPYGTCVSYQWVAQRTGNSNAFRAAGNAIGKNPIPILVPCHRVVRKDGNLGGFSSGLSIKKALLEIENCKLPSEASKT